MHDNTYNHYEFPMSNNGDHPIDQPLERLSLHAKHKVLPPLGSSNFNEYSSKPSTAQKPHVSDVINPMRKSYETHERYHYKDTATEIKESDEYIDLIMKQTKDASKRKDNSFDELCATLVKQREIERDERYHGNNMNFKPTFVQQTHGSHKTEPPPYNRMTGKQFIENTRNKIDLNLTPRDRPAEIHVQNRDTSSSSKRDERTIVERPKSAKYGGRRVAASRPRTGYGRRKGSEPD